jgi:thiol:disulfide interchange protein DsbC
MKTTDARLALRALAAKATLAAALTTCLSVTAWAQPSQPPTTPELTSLIGRLQALYPSTRFGEIRPTPWPGVFEVAMGANLAYVDASGQYFLFGHLYDMKAQRDLTAERKDTLARIDFNALPLADAIKDVRGRGSRALAIFSDPDCPHCRRLEAELKGLSDVTIHTFLMPIASLHPQARAKAIAVWCAKDRLGAWQALMTRDQVPPSADCAHPVDRNVALAERLGVTGTPTLVAADGRVLPGAASAEQIRPGCRARPRVPRAPRRATPRPRRRARRHDGHATHRRPPRRCDRHAVGRLRVHHERPRRRGQLRLQGPGRFAVHLGLGRVRELDPRPAARLRPAEARQGTRERGAHRTGCLGIRSRAWARHTAIGTPLPATRAAPVDRALGGRRRRPARGLGGARAGRHRPLADRARHSGESTASRCGRPPIPSAAPASGPSPASEPASSTETAPDRFPSRTGLLPGSGATQEP